MSVAVNTAERRAPRTVVARLLATLILTGAAAAPSLGEEINIPEQLSASDVSLYRQVWALQESGDWNAADSLIAKLENPILMGHINFQRLMHPTDYRSTFAELRDWLLAWADQPDAYRIYRLALRRKPNDLPSPRRPQTPDANGPWQLDRPSLQTEITIDPPTYRPERSANDQQRVRDAFRHVRRHVHRGEIKHALKDLERGDVITGVMDDVERAMVSTIIATGAFQTGDDALALEMAAEAAQVARQWAPEADWTAGLAAWNLGLYEIARFHFEVAASSGTLDTRENAGAAYWAARANLLTRRPADVVPWLQLAAARPHTLYGQLAARQLGIYPTIDFARPQLTQEQIEGLLGAPAARRAIALTQIGQHEWADRELSALSGAAGLEMGLVLSFLASEYGLAKQALRIGRELLHFTGVELPFALYPLVPWEPASGFTLDRALLHAFMRQESAFRTDAVSVDGARGLMQLLPSTASFIAGDRSLLRNRERLYAPEYNLELGQRYLRHLLEDMDHRGNLMMAVAAYNGGPGNLSRWTKRMGKIEDPLIFMEKIPVRETREFLELVMANLWIYRQRLNQESPTLDSMAANNWPFYRSVDEPTQTAVAMGADNAGHN